MSEKRSKFVLSYNEEKLLISLFEEHRKDDIFHFMMDKHKIESEEGISFSMKILVSVSLIASMTRYAIRRGYPLAYIHFYEEHLINRMLLYRDLKGLQKYDYRLVVYFLEMYSIPKEFSNAIIFGILNYVYDHYHEIFTIQDIADKLGKTVGYISFVFKKFMGVNLKQYITDMKITRAKQLLAESPDDIALITMYLGYNSQSYFSKVFKRNTGYTPSKYRKKYQLRDVHKREVKLR